MEFAIHAKSKDPNHEIKGTASENRKDVRTAAMKKAALWREMKLKEQAEIRVLCESGTAVPLIVYSAVLRRKSQAWWIGEAVLLKPNQCGRFCKEGWIETLPIGNTSRDVAELVAQVFAENGDDELCLRTARLGLLVAEIRRVQPTSQKGDFTYTAASECGAASRRLCDGHGICGRAWYFHKTLWRYRGRVRSFDRDRPTHRRQGARLLTRLALQRHRGRLVHLAASAIDGRKKIS